MKVNSFKHVLIHLGIMLVLGFIILFVFFSWYLPSATNKDETITVPNMKGLSYAELEAFAANHHIRYEVNDSTFSSEEPPLTVMKQYPLPGSQVKENRKIFLSLNARNPPKVRMPNLVEGSLKNAQLVLKSFGLELGEITYKPDLAANAVLEQHHKGKPIEEGAYIAKGSKIDLVVGDGKGNSEMVMENLMGKDLEEAKFVIIGQGLQVGEITYEAAPDKTPNTVLRQVPPAGVPTQIGETVDLWVVPMGSGESDPSSGLTD